MNLDSSFSSVGSNPQREQLCSGASSKEAEKIILETLEKMRNIKIRDIRKRPIVITRDFCNFPFPRLELNAEDKQDMYKSQCLKFQTSYYVAYVYSDYQEYITPDHLDNPNDSVQMREARRNNWGCPSGKVDYDIRSKYPVECGLLDDEQGWLFDQHTSDNVHIYGLDIVSKLGEIEKKYTVENYTWEYYKDTILEHSNKIKIIGATAGLVITAGVFFLCSIKVSCFFVASILLITAIELQTHRIQNIFKKEIG